MANGRTIFENLLHDYDVLRIICAYREIQLGKEPFTIVCVVIVGSHYGTRIYTKPLTAHHNDIQYGRRYICYFFLPETVVY